MGILEKLEKIQETIDEREKEENTPLLICICYPGGYEKMDDNTLKYYYKSASERVEKSFKAIKEMVIELEKRGLLEENGNEK